MLACALNDQGKIFRSSIFGEAIASPSWSIFGSTTFCFWTDEKVTTSLLQASSQPVFNARLNLLTFSCQDVTLDIASEERTNRTGSSLSQQRMIAGQ